MGERASAVCNLERGVKIAVERAAREGERKREGGTTVEWSSVSGDKSRRRYNVGL